MKNDSYIKINEDSRIPKYKQIIESIKKEISKKNLKVGDKIFSINHLSKEFNLSRDTVKKAYNSLKSQDIIISVEGKGFYVAKSDLSIELNVLFLINKLSKHKMQIFNAFVESMSNTNTNVDLEIYYCDPIIFKNILHKHNQRYDYFVIMPHFKNDNLQYCDCPSDVIEVLEKIPENKLIILDRVIEKLPSIKGSVYQDFQVDIINALTSALEIITKYEKIILIYPSMAVYPYPKEIVTGFQQFCNHNNLSHEVLDKVYDGMEFRSKDLYITIQEDDLINLINQLKADQLVPGEDIGIISYNDTPLKELLGISVISTDFNKLGELAAEMIQKNDFYIIKNDFNFINRFSA